VDKYEVIREMTLEDAKLLPDPVRQAIVATVPTPPEVQQIAEIRQALGADDKADIAKLITEMRQAQEQQRRDAIKTRITELATEGIKVDSARGIVVELVAARNPQSVQEAEQAYQEVSSSASVTELLKANVQAMMGPRQTTPVAGQQGKNKYFQIPVDA
jgi:5-formyltetrahydrofolate cyclo-ligase